MRTGTSLTKREGSAAETVQERPTVAPAVDIFENSDEILVCADLPGASGKDVNVRLDRNELTIEAKRHEEAEGTLLAAEYRPADYRRSFLVGGGIDADQISAELRHGVLKVHLPKSARLRPRQIAVRAE